MEASLEIVLFLTGLGTGVGVTVLGCALATDAALRRGGFVIGAETYTICRARPARRWIEIDGSLEPNR